MPLRTVDNGDGSYSLAVALFDGLTNKFLGQTGATPMPATLTTRLEGGQQAYTPPGNAEVIGRMVVTESERNILIARPLIGIQASASRTATAGKRTRIESLQASIVGTTGIVAGYVELVIRDGASLGGTILWGKHYAIPAAGTTTSISESDLKGIQSTVAGAITVEFTTVAGTTLYVDAAAHLRINAPWIEVT